MNSREEHANGRPNTTQPKNKRSKCSQTLAALTAKGSLSNDDNKGNKSRVTTIKKI